MTGLPARFVDHNEVIKSRHQFEVEFGLASVFVVFPVAVFRSITGLLLAGFIIGSLGVLNDVTDGCVTIHARGGDLQLQWHEDGDVSMTGPAATVYEGDFAID